MQQTRRLLKHFLDVTLNHVKGHQDDDTRYEDLDQQSRLNVDCDRKAKKAFRSKFVLNVVLVLKFVQY